MRDVDVDCLFQLRGRTRDSEISWQHIRFPYCDERAAIADAERFCERFAVVEVLNTLTNHIVYRAYCRPMG